MSFTVGLSYPRLLTSESRGFICEGVFRFCLGLLGLKGMNELFPTKTPNP